MLMGGREVEGEWLEELDGDIHVKESSEAQSLCRRKTI